MKGIKRYKYLVTSYKISHRDVIHNIRDMVIVITLYVERWLLDIWQ